MILIRLRCDKCGNVLHEVDESAVPAQLEGSLTYPRCARCWMPREVTDVKLDQFERARVLTEFAAEKGGVMEAIWWKDLRVPLATARVRGRATTVKVATPA